MPENQQEFLVDPIEPGFAFILVEMKRLWEQDRQGFLHLNELLYRLLGPNLWGDVVLPCFNDGELEEVNLSDDDLTFNIPDHFLDVILFP